MSTVRFKGRVLPAAVKLSFPETISDVRLDDGQQVSMHIRIKKSALRLTWELSRYEPTLFQELLTKSSDIVRTYLNLVSFSTTIGFIVSFDTFIDHNRRSTSILTNYPRAEGLCTAFELPTTRLLHDEHFLPILNLVCQDIYLMSALDDLATGIIAQHQGAVICGRVLDSLRRSVAPKLEPSKGWPILHDAINVEKRYVQWVSENSTDQRHGERSGIPRAVMGEMAERTWIVMNRFLEFRKRGSQKLDLSEFPVLSSSSEPS